MTEISEIGIGKRIKKAIREIYDYYHTLEILKEYEDYCVTKEIAHSNLGYMFGYCNVDDRKKLHDLFPVSHPIFGSGFGRED